MFTYINLTHFQKKTLCFETLNISVQITQKHPGPNYIYHKIKL